MGGALRDSFRVAANSTTIAASATSPGVSTTIPDLASASPAARKPRFILVQNLDASIVIVVALAASATNAAAGVSRGMPILPGESVVMNVGGAGSTPHLRHASVSGTPSIAITPIEE